MPRGRVETHAAVGADDADADRQLSEQRLELAPRSVGGGAGGALGLEQARALERLRAVARERHDELALRGRELAHVVERHRQAAETRPPAGDGHDEAGAVAELLTQRRVEARIRRREAVNAGSPRRTPWSSGDVVVGRALQRCGCHSFGE